MNKKVTLTEIVGTKIVLALIMVLYYWMWARTDWKDYYVVIQSALGSAFVVFFVIQASRIKKYKAEGIDEMAEQNLKRCDSICFKIFIIAMVVTAWVCAILVTKIKEYREKAGYKQSELAEMVGARRETIVHLENGKYNPSLKLAIDIAKVFEVTVEDLFTFIEE